MLVVSVDYVSNYYFSWLYLNPQVVETYLWKYWAKICSRSCGGELHLGLCDILWEMFWDPSHYHRQDDADNYHFRWHIWHPCYHRGMSETTWSHTKVSYNFIYLWLSICQHICGAKLLLVFRHTLDLNNGPSNKSFLCILCNKLKLIM
jgi:hypothetical protein